MKIASVLVLLTAAVTPTLPAQVFRADSFGPTTLRTENLTLIHGPRLLSLPGEPVPGQHWTTVKSGEGTLTLTSGSVFAPQRQGVRGYKLKRSPAAIPADALRSHPEFPELDTSLPGAAKSPDLPTKS